MRRLFATTAIVTLMLTAFAGCSKGKEKDTETNATPTVSVTQDDYITVEDDGSYIALGGYFTRDNANLTIYIADSGWMINGVLFPEDDKTSTLVLNGPLTYTEGTDLVYDNGSDKLTFTFAEESVAVTADKGTTYSAFAGEYKRSEDTAASDSAIIKSGTTVELLGRIAAAYYVTTGDAATDFTLDLSATTFGNEFLCNFITAYTDLFLANQATVYPEVSTEYLCYAFSKADLDNVLLAATVGTYNASKLSTEGTDIVLKDGVYYVPCRGNYAGGLTGDVSDIESVDGQLVVNATVAKKDGSRHDVEMTLSVSENSKAGTAGVQVDSVSYKVSE